MGKTAGTSSRERRGSSSGVPAGRGKKVEVFSGYSGALRWLGERFDVERTRAASVPREAFRLDRMQAMLEALGNPQDSLRCVHVAGTKGKGSTCEMTAASLEACGFTVGVYTSPHLVDVRERIRINRKPIAQADFTRVLGQCAGAAAAVEGKHGPATYFELLTALGFCHFAEQAVDVAVIEVGLGGRLDATNVITPEVCAITAIGYDHMQILGDTLEKIAREKAGIMKPGVPCVTIPQEPGVLAVLREEAARVGAPLGVLGQDIEFSTRFEYTPGIGPHARVCLSTSRVNYEHVRVPLKGEHQALNCGLSLAILDRLSERGLGTDEARVTRGLEGTSLAGRFELAWSSPRILLDVAHNPESIRALVKSIGAHLQYDSMVVVLGCCADKDVPGILRNIALGADKVIFTKAQGTSRAASPGDLHRRFAEISGKMSQAAPDLPTALEQACRAVSRDDLICVTGSFYLVGEAKRHLAELAQKRAGEARRA